jgi:hypothetical protein
VRPVEARARHIFGVDLCGVMLAVCLAPGAGAAGPCGGSHAGAAACLRNATVNIVVAKGRVRFATAGFKPTVGRLCRSADAQVKATLAKERAIKAGPGTNAQKRRRISPLLGDFVTELRHLHDKLARLDPPPKHKSAYRRYVGDLAREANLTAQARRALDRNDSATYAKVNRKVQAVARAGNAVGARVPALAPCVRG